MKLEIASDFNTSPFLRDIIPKKERSSPQKNIGIWCACAPSVVISGGNVDNGGNAGPFYWNCNWSASNANWNVGGRPLC